ncbi:MAG: nickel pincer cofactor biosynthesis protein LarC [Candidatus Thermoplasmatota archaeon]|nr:nickel pincer cofactor biosynthesis protein LarC [Candidatus Thermoplasmatota archaeon]MBS3790741.1 nickel pincer cofactor biosynthesis protein LarC [Candidatus Thermoplasmatota archaeon]
MRKIAYLDLSSGISGDMLLAGLMDLGADVKVLNNVIEELELSDLHVEIRDEERGFSGKNLKIRHKDQPHRKVVEIIEKIENSDLGEKVKEKSVEAFRLLGGVESEIHGVPFEELELHEVGMVDSIIDVVGSVALVDDLKIDEIYASTVHFGSGHTECTHGKIPVPVPATEKLLEDWNVKFTGREGELVTPTGAVMLNVLAEQSLSPDMELDSLGVGFGDREMEVPNALRIFLGFQKNLDENLDVLTFYVDDMSPELLEYGLEKIRERALEVYTLMASGKKGREGWEIKVLSKKSQTKEVIDNIFEETSTLGLRIEEGRRLVLDRRIEGVETEWGTAKVKVSSRGISPEYESCKEIAEREGISIMRVYDTVKENYEKEK